MNHLSHRIALPHNTTFNQMLYRSLVIQIFGHEAKIEKNIVDEARCGFFNVIVFKLIKINRSHLALRKLLNPIKYVEFILMFALTFPLWAQLRPMYAAFDYYEKTKDAPTWKTKFCYLFVLFVQHFLYPILLFINETLSAILRTPLAPARLLVRPILNFINDKPIQFILFSMTATLLGGALFAALLSQLIPTTLSIGAITILGIASFVLTDILLIKSSIFIMQIKEAYQTYNSEKDCEYSKANDKRTTAKITNALHGLDPKRVHVREREKQDLPYSLALFTGTERMFYAKKAIPQNQSMDATHSKYYLQSKA